MLLHITLIEQSYLLIICHSFANVYCNKQKAKILYCTIALVTPFETLIMVYHLYFYVRIYLHFRDSLED
jgi:hypothetical protein